MGLGLGLGVRGRGRGRGTVRTSWEHPSTPPSSSTTEAMSSAEGAELSSLAWLGLRVRVRVGVGVGVGVRVGVGLGVGLIESRIVLEHCTGHLFRIRIYRDMMLDSTVVCRRALGCEWGG